MGFVVEEYNDATYLESKKMWPTSPSALRDKQAIFRIMAPFIAFDVACTRFYT